MKEIHLMCDKRLYDIEDNLNTNNITKNNDSDSSKSNYIVSKMIADKINDDSDNDIDDDNKVINSNKNDKLINLQKKLDTKKKCIKTKKITSKEDLRK